MESPKPYIFTDNNPNTMEDYAKSVRRLAKPAKRVDVVLDTDMFNEVDDQFALAYLLQSEEKLNLKAICAAPFFNHHSENYDEENPLYIIGIAAATNIASALLLCPELKNRVFIVWLGGLGFDWHDNKSFNAGQDVEAARVVLSSGAPVVLLPGRGVLDHFSTTGPELRYWLQGKNAFCDYIIEKTERESQICNGEKCWSRPISDVAAVAWLLDGNFMLDRLEHSPEFFYSK